MISAQIKPNGEEYAPEAWHLLLKSRYLGCDDVKLPSGKVISIPRSSSDLDKDEFGAYMDKVEAFAGERGVWLPDLEAYA